MKNTKPLLIYNASAGSGKTFSLVIEFLRLVLDENKKDNYFSTICAMTFTNKAALEMKNRIIEALTDLSYPIENKQIKYLEFVSNELNKNSDFIKRKAKNVLNQLLHEYEQFNILTIDKFNLRLIRSFARDLKLNSSFQTSTDDNEVLSEIIDSLFSEIKNDLNDEWTKQALEYARENLEFDEAWDFKKKLNTVSSILVKENNSYLVEKLLNTEFSKSEYDNLKNEELNLRNSIEKKLDELLEEFDKINKNQIKGKSKTVNAFKNCKNKLFIDNKESNPYLFSDFVIKNINEDTKLSQEFKNKFTSFCEFYNKYINNYFTISKAREVYYLFWFVKRIAIKLEEYKNISNNILISEFNKLIANLIKDEDAPYIYEKIGHRFKHYLLDEFQDTSRLQWTNLIPLIHESISHNNTNFIVGDPKQSIYRFKNGLAEQFISLPSIYNPENDEKINQKSKLFEDMGKNISLDKNFRSLKQIVDFNNDFFTLIKDENSDLLSDFYKDINQIAQNDDSNAYIYFYNFLDTNKSKNIESNKEDENEDDNKLNFLIDWIEECKEDGFCLGDICILDYTAESCNKYASFLYKNGYNVVSADSLLVYKNDEVKLTLSYLKYVANPFSKADLMMFAEKYLTYKNKFSYDEWKKYLLSDKEKSKNYKYFDSDTFINDYFGKQENFLPSYSNIYQLLQHFYKLVGIDELSNTYIHQFTDYVFQFEQNKTSFIKDLIVDFEKNKKNISVQINESKDSIKILTAHKSKGLQFPIVFIPSLKWEIMSSDSKFLLYQEPYFYYTSLKKDFNNWNLNAIEYKKEFDKNLIDKINLLYVAFTRPERRLYIRNENGNEKHLSKKVNDWFNKLNFQKNDDKVLIIGNRDKYVSKIKDSPISYIFNNHVENLWYPNLSFNDKTKIEDEQLTEERRYGTQLHFLLSKIQSEHQIKDVLDINLKKGIVERIFKDKLNDDLVEIINTQQYKSFFKDPIDIFRERKILCKDGTKIIPDLIIIKENTTLVIDYKTGRFDEKHIKQIERYKLVLQEIGFPNVKSYLFYTTEKKWIEN